MNIAAFLLSDQDGEAWLDEFDQPLIRLWGGNRENGGEQQ